LRTATWPALGSNVAEAELPALLIVKFTILEAAIFSGQDSIELFDKSEEFVPVLFYRDKGAQLLNALAVGFIHSGFTSRRPAIKTFVRD
jgi:hypothetical protein